MGTCYWLMDEAGKRAIDVGKYGGLLDCYEEAGGVTESDLVDDWGESWKSRLAEWIRAASGSVVLISEHWETTDLAHPWETWEGDVLPGWVVDRGVTDHEFPRELWREWRPVTER